MTYAYMRRAVLETTHEGPQAIPAQVFRTVLHRFRTELSEENFTFQPCACCVRSSRSEDLCSVVFPASDDDTLPDWLLPHSWTQAAWMEEKDAWLRDVSACFATDTYLQTFFKAKDRVTFAKDRLREQSVGFAPDHDKVLPAKRFLERVEQYVKNMQQDLEDDGVPAPMGLQGPWLLRRLSVTGTPDAAFRSVQAQFCKACAAHVAQKPKPATKQSYLHLMPRGARADGW